ncbi:hypothetical protein DQ244_06825 [Blastococcus sp. TBT05-19]|uniref:Ig-like domain-containing protein n=1 Tax=Blastococcus sp. TBT05-19 TaxID=2250581 RepID=UPI000DEBB4C0|nr:Ig-like domain-containing protein [Blastococcus sp. TBT05-19]RBY92028.1 hypothetical protein DQ244_06825 [Blastococcus sp. TBT05-19]
MRSLFAVLAAGLVLLTGAPASAAPVNQPPVATGDAVAHMNDGRQLVIRVLENDTDPDGDQLTLAGVGTPTRGYAQYSSTWIYYSPHTGQVGDDTFTYTVSDGRGGTATGTVTVTLYTPLPRPAAPTGVTTPGSFVFSWSAVPGATGYRVYRDHAPIGTTTATSWTDSGMDDSSSNMYWAVALDGAGREGLASYPEIYRAVRPLTPAWLDVDPTRTGSSLELTWDSSGEGYTTWRVWRDGVAIATTRVPRFVDTGLTEGREYSYQVSRSEQLEGGLSAPVRQVPRTLTDIGWFFLQRGWDSGYLGPVTVAERPVPGGLRQDHLHGIILQQDGEAPLPVYGFMEVEFDAAGGIPVLGYPLAEQECGLRENGCGQLFEFGSIWESDVAPTTAVRDAIEAGWAATGWEDGPLGYPVAREAPVPGGVAQSFEDGAVYWSATTGAHGVSGEVHDTYAARGGVTGPLGHPTMSEACGLRDGGCYQHFQGGSIYWSPVTGARPVSGGIRDTWARQGWENGRLGYPTMSEACGLRNGGCYQHFQGGSIYSSPTGTHIVAGTIRDTWARQGWENGRLGYPTMSEACGLRNGGCYQHFQGGSIYSSPTGTHVVAGTIRDTWARQGWEGGRLGYPTMSEACGLRNGGCYQHFQGGSIYSSPAGTHVVAGAIRDAWARQGWENGRLGYPTMSETCGLRNGGCYQHFQGGSIYSSPAGTHIVAGTIRDTWARQGWEGGRLGYPTGGEVSSPTGVVQSFQGGSIRIDRATGRPVISYR